MKTALLLGLTVLAGTAMAHPRDLPPFKNIPKDVCERTFPTEAEATTFCSQYKLPLYLGGNGVGPTIKCDCTHPGIF